MTDLFCQMPSEINILADYLAAVRSAAKFCIACQCYGRGGRAGAHASPNLTVWKQEQLQQRETELERQAVVILSPLQSPIEQTAEEACISRGNWECETCQIREEIWGPADKLNGFNHGKKTRTRAQTHTHKTHTCAHARTHTHNRKTIQILSHLLHSWANKSAT